MLVKEFLASEQNKESAYDRKGRRDCVPIALLLSIAWRGVTSVHDSFSGESRFSQPVMKSLDVRVARRKEMPVRAHTKR